MKNFEFGGISLPINDGKDPNFDKDRVPSNIVYVPEKDPQKDILFDVVACTYKQVVPVVEGHKGNGKTTAIMYLAQETNNPLVFLQLTGQTGLDAFVGRWLIRDGETVWIDSPIVQAVRNGWWVCLDELNMALSEIIAVIHPLIDDRQFIPLDEKDGSVVKCHPNFKLFCTMNPCEDYVGTKELNQAFIDRTAMKIPAGYPDPKKEISIILKQPKVVIDDSGSNITKDKGIITRMVECANIIRKLNENQEITFEFSTRNLINWAMFCDIMPVSRAFEMTVCTKAEDPHAKMKLREALSKLRFKEDEIWVPASTGVSNLTNNVTF